jgi:hypothetical protein
MPVLNNMDSVRLGSTALDKVYRGSSLIWSAAPDVPVATTGSGSMATNVAFPLPIPAGRVVFLYRNQNATGTWTPVGLTRILPATDPGLARMTMWYSTADNPTVTCSSANAVVSWAAISGVAIPVGGATTHVASNTTSAVDPPLDGGTSRTLVCYATNNWTAWNTVPGTLLYKDTHAETRPSIALAMFDTGPPTAAIRDTQTRIENTGAVWW